MYFWHVQNFKDVIFQWNIRLLFEYARQSSVHTAPPTQLILADLCPCKSSPKLIERMLTDSHAKRYSKAGAQALIIIDWQCHPQSRDSLVSVKEIAITAIKGHHLTIQFYHFTSDRYSTIAFYR